MIIIRVNPKLYQNLKQNTITKHDYAYAIYSASKWAKIMRDKLDQDPRNKALAQNYAEFYAIKLKLLEKLEPKQIHKINYTKPVKSSKYFLLYRLSKFSFHSPLSTTDLNTYSELKVKTIATNLRIKRAQSYYLYPVSLCRIIANRSKQLTFK